MDHQSNVYALLCAVEALTSASADMGEKSEIKRASVDNWRGLWIIEFSEDMRTSQNIQVLDV
jgi:hypothetical protein